LSAGKDKREPGNAIRQHVSSSAEGVRAAWTPLQAVRSCCDVVGRILAQEPGVRVEARTWRRQRFRNRDRVTRLRWDGQTETWFVGDRTDSRA